MEKLAVLILLTLVMLAGVGWLGGGRKWAFRTVLAALILAGLAGAAVLLYLYRGEKTAEHRAQRLHECAVVKVAKARCDSPYAEFGGKADNCPAYVLPDNPTPGEENAAIAAAEEECAGEIDPKQKSANEQIRQYRREHGIKEDVGKAEKRKEEKWEVYREKKLTPMACAANIRKAYPHAYDDLDDATLLRKVLARYPTYCDVASPTADFIPASPVLKGIR